MDTSTIRVIIADDHPVIHHGVEGMLFADRSIVVVATVTSFSALLAVLATTAAHVVVLDLNDMGEGPLVMVRELRSRFPDTQLVIFSSNIALAPEILAAGAQGYVVKEEVLTHLPAAIHAVAAGRLYHSPLVAEHLERTSNTSKQAGLLPQELRVLRLLAQGLKTGEIAASLGIDPRTIQNYISTMYHKTGCQTRPQLVLWYQQHFGGRAA